MDYLHNWFIFNLIFLEVCLTNEASIDPFIESLCDTRVKGRCVNEPRLHSNKSNPGNKVITYTNKVHLLFQ